MLGMMNIRVEHSHSEEMMGKAHGYEQSYIQRIGAEISLYGE